MLGIRLQRHGEATLARQIYQTLREQMMSGRMKPGEALPSTRELARQLAVSRNTTCEAYEMLRVEGFIESRPGAPTRVAEGLHLDKPASAFGKPEKTARPAPPLLADFRTGQPELRRFPVYLWLQLMRQAAAILPRKQWGYTGPEGLPGLRQENAAWLGRSRGLAVDPQNIFITAGATQALHLIAELLAAEGREIMMEDPCHTGMLRVLQARGCKIHPVPVDEQGLQTEYLPEERAAAGAGAVYVTPSHQFPLGGILPAGRRAALVRYAREQDLYLLEDDYDSEFRYSGAPVAPLCLMDAQRVIYIGTFSKILFPALRIGYAVLPPQLHEQWRRLRTHADVQNPPFEQAALAEYLRTRKLDRHVQRMRRLYAQRRQVLLQALTENFGRVWRPWGDAAGLHLALEFSGWNFDRSFAESAREQGIRLATVEYYSIRKGSHADKLLLGYGHLEAEEIRGGIRLLHGFMQEKDHKV